MIPATPVTSWVMSPERSLRLDAPRLIAIINVTPDSFSDGGECAGPDAALARAVQAEAEGADALDIGGESTRPGALRVSDDVQIARVVPAIRAIRACPGAVGRLPITVDTTRAVVARAAIDAGADAVNDQSAGRDDPGMHGLLASRRRGVIMMHRPLPPERDVYSYEHPRESGDASAIQDIAGFLRERAASAERAGIGSGAIVLDPGLGFGKSVERNWALIAAAPELLALGYPLLCAVSRKSFIGAACARPDGTIPPPRERVAGSVGVAVSQYLAGVRLFRVHDVREHREALDACARLAGPTPGQASSLSAS